MTTTNSIHDSAPAGSGAGRHAGRSDTDATRRRLGNSEIEVSALGLGCWAIGGPFTMFGQPDGWGDVDDDESVRALRRAHDLGVTFFDTADAYGTGHSEEVLGRALAGNRDQVVIATKFGFTYDESAARPHRPDASPGYVRRACEASLKRLGTDYIDLYQLHIGELTAARGAGRSATSLEDLLDEGTIRAYGWSTGDAAAREACSPTAAGVPRSNTD